MHLWELWQAVQQFLCTRREMKRSKGHPDRRISCRERKAAEQDEEVVAKNKIRKTMTKLLLDGGDS